MATMKRDKKVFAEINIVPLTDVCLVLLIIFMVSATILTQNTGLNVDLPKAASAQDLPARNVELMVTSDGTLYVDGQAVHQPQLAEALQTKLQQTSLNTVVVKADAAVAYRHVADAVDAACSLGAEITLAADQKPPGT